MPRTQCASGWPRCPLKAATGCYTVPPRSLSPALNAAVGHCTLLCGKKPSTAIHLSFFCLRCSQKHSFSFKISTTWLVLLLPCGSNGSKPPQRWWPSRIHLFSLLALHNAQTHKSSFQTWLLLCLVAASLSIPTCLHYQRGTALGTPRHKWVVLA